MTLMVSVSGVRGVVGPELNPLVISEWAAAFGELVGPGPMVIGRDSRRTGAVLASTVGAVLRSMGHEVWDVGVVPTPTVQLAVEIWEAAGGIILSASHNPAQWNALKFVDRGGSFASPERFAELRAGYEARRATFVGHEGYGGSVDRGAEALRLHRDRIVRRVDVDRIRAAGIRVVIDTGHGAGGVLLPDLAADLGVELVCNRCEPNGLFAPNPEPSEEGLRILMKDAGSGPAFVAMSDPDADRFAVALPGTPFIGEEWTLPLVARSVLEKKPGPLVTNLSTSSRIDAAAARFGATVHRTPVGEAHVVARMRSVGAILGGEGNGGVIDPAVHLGRDAAVAFARLCEAEAAVPGGLRALAAEFPERHLGKAKLPVPAGGLESLRARIEPVLGPPEDVTDGWRWSRPDGFVHIRPSGTEPIVRVIVEAASGEAATELLERLRATLRTV